MTVCVNVAPTSPRVASAFASIAPAECVYLPVAVAWPSRSVLLDCPSTSPFVGIVEVDEHFGRPVGTLAGDINEICRLGQTLGRQSHDQIASLCRLGCARWGVAGDGVQLKVPVGRGLRRTAVARYNLVPESLPPLLTDARRRFDF